MYLKTVKRRRLTVMEDTQLTLRDVLGPLTDFFTKLLSKDGPKWLCEFKKFLRKERVWAQEILELVGIVKIPATSKFVAKDYFTTSIKAVKFAWIGDNFKQHFLHKVEEPQGEMELRVSQLKKNSLDKPILAELGDKAETTLSAIWELLTKQPNGESGVLLTNGYANIFYVRDAKGVLWAVSAGWHGDGWSVDAYSVEAPLEWYEGYLVFSRNS
jgi:hypothetical protein